MRGLLTVNLYPNYYLCRFEHLEIRISIININIKRIVKLTNQEVY